eukprot:scaffold108541_cov51-Phaeocystis_antarctica.AAC.1
MKANAPGAAAPPAACPMAAVPASSAAERGLCFGAASASAHSLVTSSLMSSQLHRLLGPVRPASSKARLVALGCSALSGRGRPTKRPATASGARASHCLGPDLSPNPNPNPDPNQVVHSCPLLKDLDPNPNPNPNPNQVVHSCPLLKDLSPEDLASVAGMMKLRAFRADEQLCTVGDP